MKKHLWVFSLFAAVLIPLVSSAQKLERTKNWGVGDKATWNYVLQGKSMRFVQEVVEVTDAEIRSTLEIGERTHHVVGSTRELSCVSGICLPNGQKCTFSPEWVWFNFPLEKGKTWSATTTVTGESFISETAYEAKVDGVEKITTPAGQFDAYKLSGIERIESRNKLSGGPIFHGTSNYSYWVASIKGKLVCVRNEYHNSFGEVMTRELLSTEFK